MTNYYKGSGSLQQLKGFLQHTHSDRRIIFKWGNPLKMEFVRPQKTFKREILGKSICLLDTLNYIAFGWKDFVIAQVWSEIYLLAVVINPSPCLTQNLRNLNVDVSNVPPSRQFSIQ